MPSRFGMALLVALLMLLLGGAQAEAKQAQPGWVLTPLEAPQQAPVAAGGGWQLSQVVEPEGTGTPCCCLFLPCVEK